MTFEVGVRNTGLGLLLVFTYFDGLGGMALVAAWWGLYDILAGLVVAAVWRAADGVDVPDRRWRHEGPGHRRQRLPRAARSSPGSTAAGHEVVSADLRPPAVVMDVTSRSAVDAVIGEARPEVVVHLASIVTPGPDSTRELEYAVDVDGTRTSSTRAWPTAYAGSSCRRAARRTATTPTTRRGSPRTSRCAATRSSPTATTSGWSRRCCRRTRRWSRWCCGSAPSSAPRSTTRSPRSSSASGC